MIGLNQIFEDHKKWLTGKGGKQADLREANLYGADLYGADLRRANLREANLRRANLRRANLREANLYGAYLSGANLRRANLREADLREANLYGANLSGADLSGADLRGADLREENLRGADLRGTDLRKVILDGANLYRAKLPPYQICDGDIIGWKKVDAKMVKLLIPKEAKRTASLVGRKCRAEFAKVISIEGNYPVKTERSLYSVVIYSVGNMVYPDKYDDDPRVECTNGIHFFQTKEEAEDY